MALELLQALSRRDEITSAQDAAIMPVYSCVLLTCYTEYALP